MLIHAGVTQSCHLNRLELDDHPLERMQTFSFGVKSLLRTAIDCVVDNASVLLTTGPKEDDIWKKEGQKQEGQWILDRLAMSIPMTLAEAICNRMKLNDDMHNWCYDHLSPPDTDEPNLEREIIHAGI